MTACESVRCDVQIYRYDMEVLVYLGTFAHAQTVDTKAILGVWPRSEATFVYANT